MKPDGAPPAGPASGGNRPPGAGLGVGLLAVVALLVWVEGYYALRHRPGAVPVTVACPAPAAGCAFTTGGLPVRVRFTAIPKALRPFDLQVEARVDAVHVRVRAVGADPIEARYAMARTAPGRFTARVILPASAGGGDWLLDLYLDGRLVRIPFHADP